MKGFVFAVAFALGVLGWLALPADQFAQNEAVVTAGIDGGGEARSDCLQAGSDWMSGCESDELRPIVVAGISGGDQP